MRLDVVAHSDSDLLDLVPHLFLVFDTLQAVFAHFVQILIDFSIYDISLIDFPIYLLHLIIDFFCVLFSLLLSLFSDSRLIANQFPDLGRRIIKLTREVRVVCWVLLKHKSSSNSK